MAGLTTIVIPCYNQAHYLAEAVRSGLAQDGAEIIVVDDGSTDESASVAAQFPDVRVVRQANSGVANARNAGARAGRGEFLLFLDADDRLRPGAVARLRAAIERSPRAAFAFGRFDAIDTAGQRLPSPVPPRHEGTPYESLLQSNFICAPATVLYRREMFLNAGGFPSGIDPAADYALYMQLARTSEIAEVEDVVAEYRLHDRSMSSHAGRMLVATLEAHARERTSAATPNLRKQWAAGRTHWREWYGNRLVDQIRAEWRARSLRPMARDLLVLARYAPRVLIAHAKKKVTLSTAAYRTR